MSVFHWRYEFGLDVLSGIDGKIVKTQLIHRIKLIYKFTKFMEDFKRLFKLRQDCLSLALRTVCVLFHRSLKLIYFFLLDLFFVLILFGTAKGEVGWIEAYFLKGGSVKLFDF